MVHLYHGYVSHNQRENLHSIPLNRHFRVVVLWLSCGCSSVICQLQVTKRPIHKGLACKKAQERGSAGRQSQEAVPVERYPLVMTNIAMEHHHFLMGKLILNCRESTMDIPSNRCFHRENMVIYHRYIVISFLSTHSHGKPFPSKTDVPLCT